VNIREIANLAGVSVSTVSKIINRKDDNISDETRQKVLAIVKQYHYRPYASAQAPCNTNTFLLGAIMNASCRHPELWEFIGKCVSEKGYSLVLCHAKNPEEELRSLKILQGHHVAGVIWDKDQSSLPECRSVLKGVPVKEISCYEPPGMQIALPWNFIRKSKKMNEVRMETVSTVFIEGENHEYTGSRGILH